MNPKRRVLSPDSGGTLRLPALRSSQGRTALPLPLRDPPSPAHRTRASHSPLRRGGGLPNAESITALFRQSCASAGPLDADADTVLLDDSAPLTASLPRRPASPPDGSSSAMHRPRHFTSVIASANSGSDGQGEEGAVRMGKGKGKRVGRRSFTGVHYSSPAYAALGLNMASTRSGSIGSDTTDLATPRGGGHRGSADSASLGSQSSISDCLPAYDSGGLRPRMRKRTSISFVQSATSEVDDGQSHMASIEQMLLSDIQHGVSPQRQTGPSSRIGILKTSL